MQTIAEAWAGAREWKITGRFVRLLETVNAVDLRVYSLGALIGEAKGIEAGYFFELHEIDRVFDRIEIVTGAAEAVKWVYAMDRCGYDRLFASVQVNAVTINKATVITEGAPVAVGTAIQLIAAASAARRAIRFLNDGTTDLYLGSATLTTANSPVRVPPGELWNETEAPGAAWYGRRATGSANVRYHELS